MADDLIRKKLITEFHDRATEVDRRLTTDELADIAIATLVAAPQSAAVKPVAWLIEWPADDNVPTRWWHPDTGWMRDANKAVRFSRSCDADAYIKTSRFDGWAKAIEHKWVNNAAPTTSPEPEHQWDVRRSPEKDEVGGTAYEVKLPDGNWRCVFAVDQADARITVQSDWEASTDVHLPSPEPDAVRKSSSSELWAAHQALSSLGEWQGNNADVLWDEITRLHAALSRPAHDVLTNAARDVINERDRQQAVEGHTHVYDDGYTSGELATAAACYALYENGPRFSIWPWPKSWKPKTRRENLVRAGALLLAEIERIDRRDGVQ